MVVMEAGILCWLVCYVRGGNQRFGELNTCAGYTPPGNNRVVYQYCHSHSGRGCGIHHPEITGLYTKYVYAEGKKTGIHHPEITGLYTITPRKDGSRLGYTPPRNNRVVYHKMPHVEFEERYTPPRNNGVVYRWTLCYHCRDGEDIVQSLHTFSAAVSYSATSHRAFSTCL